MKDQKEQAYKSVDKFDAAIGSLQGRADVTSVAPSTKQVFTPVIGGSQTFTVQTFRPKDEGDWLFITYIDGEGSFRMAIPPIVCEVIARQRDALTAKNRKRAGRERAAADKAAGKVPGYMRKKPKKKGSKDDRGEGPGHGPGS